MKIQKFDKSERDKQLNINFKLDNKIRAPFLLQAIGIDVLISEIISHHFISEEDNRKLFISLIMGPGYLSFASKIKILKELLKLRYPNLEEKYPKLINKLEKVRNFRNKIVHSMLHNPDEYLKKKYTDRIELGYYKNGEKKYQIITLADMDKKLVACSQIVYKLQDIRREVMQRIK